MQPLPALGQTFEFSRTIAHGDVAAFADLSGDRNPLYLDDEFAAGTPFGHRVVHGALLAGLITAALTELTGPGYVLLGQELRFSSPVPVGEEVTVQATVIRIREDKPIVSVETLVLRADGRVAVRGVGGLLRLDAAAAGRE